MFELHVTTAPDEATGCPESRSGSAGGSANALRAQILAMRKAKREELLQALSSPVIASSLQPPLEAPDRFSWVGIDEDEQETLGTHAQFVEAASDDGDDADSTVLGHLSAAFPLPALDLPPTQTKARTKTNERKLRDSGMSLATTSSATTHSRSSVSQEEDCDSQSVHTLTTVDESSDNAKARTARSSSESRGKRRSGGRHARPGTASSIQSTASTRPRCPPPDFPLPPAPRTPASPASFHSPISGQVFPRRAGSTSRSSVKSSVRSHGTSTRSSSRLSDNDEVSEDSADEIKSIRRISAFFPPPAPGLPTSDYMPSQRRSSKGSSHKSRERRTSPFWSPRHSASLRSPGTPGSNSAYSRFMYSSLDAPPSAVRAQHESDEVVPGRSPAAGTDVGDVDDDVSDSDLSDVLHVTAAEGVLAVAQRASPVSAGQIARIGLGIRSPGPPGSSRDQSSKEGPPHSPSNIKAPDSQPSESDERRRDSLMRKSLNGLVAALDEEAARWSFDSPPEGNNGKQADELRQSVTPPAASSSAPPTSTPVKEEQQTLSASTSVSSGLAQRAEIRLPALSGRQVDADASGQVTPSKEKDLPPQGRLAEEGTGSIGESSPTPGGQLPTSFSAPTVRIHHADGEDGTASELDFTTTDDDENIPRKRTKQARRRRAGLGFEDQRAALSRGPSARSLQPGQIFRAPAGPMPSQTLDAPLASQQPGSDPYAFYEFSPSLPPFVPTGLQPRDLTGTGTWSSIVARANSSLARQLSVSSVNSFATAATAGPISLKEVAASARAKMEQAEAARRARESQCELFASLSYKPFEIHQHAKREAKAVGRESSVVGASSGRSTAMSMFSNQSTSMVELGGKWPVAIGEGDGDTEAGGAGSDISTARSSLIGLGIRSSAHSTELPVSAPPPAAKVYAEVCMQTSPTSTPPASPTRRALLALNGTDVVADVHQTPRAADKRRRAPSRRKTMAALSQAYGIDLDTPDFKGASKMRAPRLSSRRSEIGLRRRPSASTELVPEASAEITANVEELASSSDESDLDVGAQLEELASRTGVLDEARGSKRKLRSSTSATASSGPSRVERPIATIPARVRNSMQRPMAVPTGRRRRADSGTGWTSSEDDSEDEEVFPVATQSTHFSTPQPSRESGSFQLRPLLLPRSVPAKSAGPRRIASLTPVARALPTSPTSADRPAASRSLTSRVASARAPSPDLSFQTLAGGDEDEEDDSLMSAKLDLSGNNSVLLLEDEDDTDVDAVKANLPIATAEATGDTASPIDGPPNQTTASTVTPAEDGEEPIEIIKEAEEVLSSAGHGTRAPSSLGHGSVSDSGGTSGHDPQRRPNEVLAEIVRQRLAIRVENALASGASGLPSRSSHALATAAEASPAADVADFDTLVVRDSPLVQDTPDTVASSGAWSSYRHTDRDSSASTATSWSGGSFVENADEAKRAVGAPFEANADLEEAITQAPATSAASKASFEAAVGITAPPVTTSSGLPRTLHRKASGLPMPKTTRRSVSEAIGAPSKPKGSGTAASAAPPLPTSSDLPAASRSGSLKQLHAIKKGQRPSLPPPVAYSRHESVLASPKVGADRSSMGGVSVAAGQKASGARAQQLRKMKSFGDRSSNTFVPPPASTLPRSIGPPKAKSVVPLSAPALVGRKVASPTSNVAPAGRPKSTLRQGGETVVASTASAVAASGMAKTTLKHPASLQGLSRLPTPSTPSWPASGLPRPSGLPTPTSRLKH